MNEPAEKTENFLKEMYEKGMHLGYSPTSCHPKMKPFIFDVKGGVEIFDLEKTQARLNAAKDFMRNIAKEGRTILFVGTKKEAREETDKIAHDLKMPYVKERWVGGALTNFKEIKSRVDYLIDLKAKKVSGDLEKYTKKERLRADKKIQKMEKYMGGLEGLKDYPSAIVVIDPKHERISVDEAVNKKIPVIALMSSDCDPGGINYPVPANDSSLSSIVYFLSEISKAFKEGVKIKEEEGAKIVNQEEPKETKTKKLEITN